jgi:16S rRNA (cytosine1402-N4)-methyltransferase
MRESIVILLAIATTRALPSLSFAPPAEPRSLFSFLNNKSSRTRSTEGTTTSIRIHKNNKSSHTSRSHQNGSINFFAASNNFEHEETAGAGDATTSPSALPLTTPPPRRRERYAGRYPRNFKDKYKEIGGDEDTIHKVLAKGMTPAGTHVPIMVKECLHYMGLEDLLHSSYMTTNENQAQAEDTNKEQPLLVVDCTLGYGGHSSYILKYLGTRRSNDGSRLIAFDQDSLEIKKTEERLLNAVKENLLPNLPSVHVVNGQDQEQEQEKSIDQAIAIPQTYTHDIDLFTAVNQNFQTLGTYLSSVNQTGKVTSLLADLGLSSMQIDDNDRGFTYKRSGPLDMRMNPDTNTENAYDLLRRLRVRQLRSMLKENSDEEFADEIAAGLIGGNGKGNGNDKGNGNTGGNIPETTLELADRVRDIVRPLIEKQHGNVKMSSNQMKEMKRRLDSTVARVMQAIRIEVNGEFEVLEKLLEDVPNVLAPGGKAVFLTFHSGEDRRVKKSFKAGYKSGIYTSWSSDVVRPSKEERRNNPRSSCCKLRWAIRSED